MTYEYVKKKHLYIRILKSTVLYFTVKNAIEECCVTKQKYVWFSNDKKKYHISRHIAILLKNSTP